MFAGGYLPASYFPPSYFAGSGGVPAPLPTPGTDGGYFAASFFAGAYFAPSYFPGTAGTGGGGGGGGTTGGDTLGAIIRDDWWIFDTSEIDVTGDVSIFD